MGKNSKKTNVKSSILILLLIAILLIASTYAWFTSNRTVTISSIDVNVAASTGIQISVDGINWKSVISNEDITGAASTYENAVNRIPASMAPVSSIGEVTGDRMKMFFGTVQDNKTTGEYELYTAASAENDATSGKYVVFDVFVKVDENETVYLTEGSDVTHKATAGTPTDKGLKNASRVAFCVLGQTGLTSTVAQIQGITGGTTSYIWEPNYDVHTQAGANAAYSIYGHTVGLTGASQLAYYGVKAPIPQATPVALDSHDTNYFTQITNPIKTEAGRSLLLAADPANAGTIGTTQLMSMNAGITKIRIYMWIEGQDVDCENTASGSDIRYDIGFTIDAINPSASQPEEP